tara:strand:+ start:26 stop:448 length:423 start_codon:yes stop_codon:yes gene_type:complete
MPVATYFKDKQKKIESKYHQVAQRVEFQYDLIHRQVTSRFHREISETDFISSKIYSLITKPSLSKENKYESKRFIPFFSITSAKKIDKHCVDNIDWTRGRFLGQTIHIVIRQGKIIEKVFLTPKGNLIAVKRSELGIRFR